MASGKYVDQLEEVLRYSAPKGRIGGLFAESIQVFTLLNKFSKSRVSNLLKTCD